MTHSLIANIIILKHLFNINLFLINIKHGKYSKMHSMRTNEL